MKLTGVGAWIWCNTSVRGRGILFLIKVQPQQESGLTDASYTINDADAKEIVTVLSHIKMSSIYGTDV